MWDPVMAEKAGYRHFMLKEIYEQPRAAEETILGRLSLDTGKVFLEELNISEADLRSIERSRSSRVAPPGTQGSLANTSSSS